MYKVDSIVFFCPLYVSNQCWQVGYCLSSKLPLMSTAAPSFAVPVVLMYPQLAIWFPCYCWDGDPCFRPFDILIILALSNDNLYKVLQVLHLLRYPKYFHSSSNALFILGLVAMMSGHRSLHVLRVVAHSSFLEYFIIENCLAALSLYCQSIIISVV